MPDTQVGTQKIAVFSLLLCENFLNSVEPNRKLYTLQPLTCHLSPLVLHHPSCPWKWYAPLPSNSGLRDLFFHKLDLCLSPWVSRHRLFRQQASWVFRQMVCICGTETSWPVWESNPWFHPVAVFDDSSTFKAPLASEHFLVWLLWEFWQVDRVSLYRRRRWDPDIPYGTPVVIGRTQDKNTNASIFCWTSVRFWTQMMALILAVQVKVSILPESPSFPVTCILCIFLTERSLVH